MRRATLLLPALILALAACGGGSAPATAGTQAGAPGPAMSAAPVASTAPDAATTGPATSELGPGCGLLDEAIVAALAGRDITGRAEYALTEGASGCEYVLAALDTLPVEGSVTIEVATQGGERALQGIRDGSASLGYREAPDADLGDAAFWGVGGELYLFQGSYTFMAQVLTPGGESMVNEGAEVELVKLLVARVGA